MDKDNIMHQDTVALDPQTEELVILDQTRLPGQTVFLRLSTAEAIYQAIYTLQVRGAPAIGVAAAIGIYAVCRRMPETDYETFAAEFERIRAYLVSARPTAVNLAWALEQMAQVVREHAGCRWRRSRTGCGSGPWSCGIRISRCAAPSASTA